LREPLAQKIQKSSKNLRRAPLTQSVKPSLQWVQSPLFFDAMLKTFLENVESSKSSKKYPINENK
jgi:hypothetical protein